MSNTPTPPRPKRSVARKSAKKPMSKGLRTLVVTVGVVVALALAATAFMGFLFWRLTSAYEGNVETIAVPFPDEENRPERPDDNSQTILLIGSDTRGEADEGILVGPQDGRSDTIMIARIPDDREEVVLVSIMRDSWVDIPGFGPNKVNAALAYGGVPLAVETLETLLDTRIDHVALIDFNGFQGLTNALGGVTVNNGQAFEAQGFTFAQGPITLNGEEALAYVRTRKAFGDGDYRRVANQQAYMKGVANQLLSRDTLSSPNKVINVVEELAPYLTVSEGLNTTYFVKLAPSLRNIRSSDLLFTTAPTEGPSTSDDGQSIILLDPKGMEELRQAFHDDTLVEYVESQKQQ